MKIFRALENNTGNPPYFCGISCCKWPTDSRCPWIVQWRTFRCSVRSPLLMHSRALVGSLSRNCGVTHCAGCTIGLLPSSFCGEQTHLCHNSTDLTSFQRMNNNHVIPRIQPLAMYISITKLIRKKTNPAKPK